MSVLQIIFGVSFNEPSNKYPHGVWSNLSIWNTNQKAGSDEHTHGLTQNHARPICAPPDFCETNILQYCKRDKPTLREIREMNAIYIYID